MKIAVKVNTNSQKQRVFLKEGQLYVYFRGVREDGKANEKLIEILAEEWDLSQSQIQIQAGHQSTRKLIQLQWLTPEEQKCIESFLSST
jgi:uncharacterized protein YggU (UPF0235/DUF167 family)